MKWKTLAVVSIVLVGCSESEETRKQRFLAQGNDKMSTRNYSEAVTFYEGAIQLDSCFTEALNNLGTALYNQGDYQGARIYYTQAIGCNENYMPSYLNRANTYFSLKLYPKALEDLAIVKRFKPDTLALHFLSGLVYTEMREFPKAKLAFKKALKISPENAELFTNLGAVYYYEKDYDSARYFLNKVPSDVNAAANAWNVLALVETDNQNYKSALSFIERALSRQPRNAFFLNNRGYIYLLQGRKEDALNDINESITIDVGNAWAYRNKGIYYFREGNVQEAVRLLKLSEEKDSEVDSLYYYLAEATWSEGMRKEACLYYEKGIRRSQVDAALVKKRCP